MHWDFGKMRAFLINHSGVLKRAFLIAPCHLDAYLAHHAEI